MDSETKNMLTDMAKKIRVDIIEMLCSAGSGHSGGSLSMADVFAYLYFSGRFKLGLEYLKNPSRDRVVLSKGHACPVLYAALAEKGYFDKSYLLTLRKYGSILQGHPDMNKTPGVEITTGSLGQGLSCAVGMAIGTKLDSLDSKIFVILGDGECDEGQVWEAAMAGSHYKLSNIIAIVDRNGLQIDGYTKDIMNTEPLVDKWSSFGWEVFEINGHDFNEIENSINRALATKEKPSCIIANTVKGKGVSFMEDRCEWHGKTPSVEEKEKAICDLCGIEND